MTQQPSLAAASPEWAPTPEALAAAATDAMGLEPQGPQADGVLDAARTAIALVDGYLGRDADDPLPDPLPLPIWSALVIVTTEVFRRKDAAFGVLNGWSASDFGPVRISTDWVKGVESLLHPYMRDHFGIG